MMLRHYVLQTLLHCTVSRNQSTEQALHLLECSTAAINTTIYLYTVEADTNTLRSIVSISVIAAYWSSIGAMSMTRCVMAQSLHIARLTLTAVSTQRAVVSTVCSSSAYAMLHQQTVHTQRHSHNGLLEVQFTGRVFLTTLALKQDRC
jgi:hypothetical protein